MTTDARSPLRLVLALQAGAAVLYLLAQAGRLIAPESLSVIRPMDALFTGGNVAVAMLLALAGFALTAGLLEARPGGIAAVLRRSGGELAVLVFAVVLVCVAALVVDATDDTDGADWSTTWRSILRVLSFRSNAWLLEQPGAGRTDLTSLWFFSVLVQLMLVAILLVLALGGRPLVLAGVLTMAAVACAAHRVLLLDEQGWFAASLGTLTRGDAFLLGAAAAALGTRLRWGPATAGAVFGGAVMVLGGAVLAASFLTVEETFRVLAPLVAMLTALAALAAAHHPDPRTLAVEVLDREPVALVGRDWYLVVAWAPFVAVTAGRHLDGQPTGLASVVTVLVTGVLTVGSSWLLLQVAERVDRHRSVLPARHRGGSASVEVGGDDRRAGSEPPADA